MSTRLATPLAFTSGLALAVGAALAGCGEVSTTCQPGSDTCGANAVCVDEGGEGVCRCATGYTRDGDACVDVDECTTDPCAEHAACTNSPGSYACACDLGYTGDGFTCTLVDCGGLMPPLHGTVVTAGGTTYGQTATYGCSATYELVGSPTRTCAADGAWTGTEPVCTPACTTLVATLYAVQSTSVNYPSGSTYNDNMVRAYSNPTASCGGPTPPCDITGWLGFNTAPIPDTAEVQEALLHVYVTTVHDTPSVRVEYSTANNWARATATAASLPRVTSVSNPVGLTAVSAGTTVVIPLIVPPPALLQADLDDNWLSLGLDNTNTAYTYAYFDGSDTTGNRPYLRVTYCN